MCAKGNFFQFSFFSCVTTNPVTEWLDSSLHKSKHFPKVAQIHFKISGIHSLKGLQENCTTNTLFGWLPPVDDIQTGFIQRLWQSLEKERVFEQFINKLKTILLTELLPPRRSYAFPNTGPTAENTQDLRMIKTVVNRTSGPLVMNGSLHTPRCNHLACHGQHVGGQYFYLKADKDCISDLCRVNDCYCKYKYSNFV